ncbi:MAG: tetratricopeptide repeat protein [Bacteroidales bacterium]|nr:tetratricopeptide repeat protein [Bacteroidales bacterium]
MASCSTQKAKWGNIRYHNLTCHYNVWWNGNESLKAGREKLYKTSVDDYTQLILPENLGDEATARSVNPEMDRAIEKGVKGIQKHSIFVKGQEHVPYIKECYLLTAYATFYKQDYTSTANTCNILISQFSGTHAGDEGAVLLARCMTKEKRYSDAEAALDQLVDNLAKGNFGRRQRDKLYMAMVEATVPQEKYKKAVEYIHLAIDASHSRRDKARLTFLMAQIYQKLEKRTVAAKYYHQVLSYSPPYVLEFNARLGEASCADLGHSDLKKLERQLDAMLHDKKNEEYRDQIYYAKGEMYLGMKDAKKACDNYRQSVAVSTQNQAQKAKSAIRMAEVLYDLYENYDLSQVYYDTAMQIIKPGYPHYSQIRRRYEMLTELVSFTRVYERADSLLAVASLPEAERIALINAKIDTLRRQEEAAKEKALLEEMMAETKAMQNTLSGDWYFYNPNTVQKGKETFRQRWGMRTLEDYWFLSNRSMIGVSTMTDDGDSTDDDLVLDDTTSSDTTKVDKDKSKYGNPNDPHDVAYYIKDLPTSQHQLDSLDSITSLSLLGAGYIYYDGVGNIQRSLDCYLRMAKDYTSYDEIVQAFYMLYRIFDRQGNTPQANYYRDMVLMGFPDSDFANLIRDNEYYKELLAREKRIESDYEELYNLFSQHRYSSAISLVEQAEEAYPGNAMLPKFRFWKGMSLAATGDRQEAISVFEAIVSQSPRGDSIIPLAESQLDLLRSDRELAAADETITDRDEQRVRNTDNTGNQTVKQSGTAEDDLPPEALVYRFRERQQYYVVVVINDRTVKATELQYRIADFNSQYYSNSGYKVNALLFTDTTQMLTVHRFATADEAMGYYRHLGQEESPLRQLSDKDYTYFIISTQNYSTFYNRKNIPAYMAYFRKYHLKQ